MPMNACQRVLSLCLGASVTLLTATNAHPTSPALGDQAPRVEGKDQNGHSWKLADAIGKHVVLLYFYPKDDTPGCTKEACGLRDRMESLKKANVEVVGVSRDPEESHRKFIDKHNLNFTLLADTDGKITEAYGAKMSGREMSRRVSFLIGLDGRIVHVTDSPDAAIHLSEMKDAVVSLKK
jgi:thioredoxin-dependent peroxiredoxin